MDFVKSGPVGTGTAFEMENTSLLSSLRKKDTSYSTYCHAVGGFLLLKYLETFHETRGTSPPRRYLLRVKPVLVIFF